MRRASAFSLSATLLVLSLFVPFLRNSYGLFIFHFPFEFKLARSIGQSRWWDHVRPRGRASDAGSDARSSIHSLCVLASCVRRACLRSCWLCEKPLSSMIFFSFKRFDKTLHTRVSKRVRLGTPIEKNSLITFLANLLLTISSMYCFTMHDTPL